MKYEIIHDTPGRIRLRCGEYAFSLDESYSIASVLEKYNYIKEVKTSHITGSMKDSSDIAREVADISLLSSDLKDIVTIRLLSKKLIIITDLSLILIHLF